MGDIQGKGDDDEKPVHEVTLGNFMAGQYEVTVGEFKRFVEASGYEVKSVGWCDWQSGEFAKQDMQPVQCVSWEDSIASEIIICSLKLL